MRCAVYCRLSEEDRNKKSKTDESESIQNQKSLLLEYCRKNCWEVLDVYCDEDMSGADRQRPEFNRMINDCKTGKVDIVLCKTQSRFSRDIEVVEHYIHNKFSEWGVRFVSILDHADTEDFANKKSRQINGLVNEWYLEDLSENIRKTLRHKKEKGIYTGSFAPYGYKLSKELKGKLFVDEVAAETVRDIYSMYLSGYGYVKIAKMLNSKGTPSPAEYKRLCGSKFKTHSDKPTSKIWTESVIREILTNRVYVGDLVQGKTSKLSYKSKKRIKTPKEDLIIMPDAHEKIISEKIWYEVNSRIGSGAKTSSDGQRHILSGKVFCENCKSAMWKMSYKLKDGRYEYLKCKATKCSDALCNNKESIRFDVVKDFVCSEIKKLLSKYYNPDAVRVKRESKVKSFAEREEQSLKDKILKQKLNIKQLYKDKLDGIINSEIFYDIHAEIENDIKTLEKMLLSIKKNEKQDFNLDEYIKNFCERIELDEYAVSKFINRVEIGKADNGIRKITIFWNL